MNQSQYAARHGVSPKTVTKWKERGWLVFAGDEVDVEASDANVKRYRTKAAEVVSQSAEGKSKGKTTAGVTRGLRKVTMREGETPAEAAVRQLVATGANMNVDEAKRVKENYLALQAQLEYDRDAGLVVDVADVAKAVGDEYAKVRTRLLAIPAEHAPRLQLLKSAVELQDALHEIIVEALEELTRDGVAR
ncbi:hypothetical protein [Paraburkholderia phenoliruptrix]|uniref:hypothetical protein n=1 Tax=Paraburkholderia phenoliruptrix TaxID=252970 RepID=UPI003D966CE1